MTPTHPTYFAQIPMPDGTALSIQQIHEGDDLDSFRRIARMWAYRSGAVDWAYAFHDLELSDIAVFRVATVYDDGHASLVQDVTDGTLYELPPQ